MKAKRKPLTPATTLDAIIQEKVNERVKMELMRFLADEHTRRCFIADIETKAQEAFNRLFAASVDKFNRDLEGVVNKRDDMARAYFTYEIGKRVDAQMPALRAHIIQQVSLMLQSQSNELRQFIASEVGRHVFAQSVGLPHKP